MGNNRVFKYDSDSEYYVIRGILFAIIYLARNFKIINLIKNSCRIILERVRQIWQ